MKKLFVGAGLAGMLLLGACGAEETVKEEPKQEVKEDAKAKAKEEPKQEVKEDAKAKAKEEPKQEVKEDAKAKAKEEAKKKADAEKKAEAEKKAKAKAEAKKKEEAEKKRQEHKAMVDDVNAKLKLLRQHMTNMDIEFVEKDMTFYMTPTDPAFAQELTGMIAGVLPTTDWDMLVQTQAELSENFKGYSIGMKNPLNTENIIILTKDGKVVYDAMKEL